MAARQGPSRGDVDTFNSRGVKIDYTAADMAAVEQRVRQGLIQQAVQNIADIQQQGDAVVRDLLPQEDLGSGSANGWNGTDADWTQTGLTADSWNETYSVDSDAKADNKIIAILAVTNLDSSPATNQIRFQTGTGGTFEQLDTEGLLADEEVTGMLADPVYFGATDNGAIQQYTTATDDEVVFHGLVAEPEGTTLEESGRFVSDRLPSF